MVHQFPSRSSLQHYKARLLTHSRHGLKDVLRKPVTMASLRHMLHKWMPRRNASSFKLQSQPTPLGRGIHSGSGIFSARILMVEDCEVTAMATQCMFQEMGLWIDSVVDGEAGMRALSGAAAYDLILLDVNLPNMSGYALCSWYKEHCRIHDLPRATVVAVTSDPDKEVCMQFGFDHVLPKPLTAVACYKVLRRWLDSRAHRMLRTPSSHTDGEDLSSDDYVCRELDGSVVGGTRFGFRSLGGNCDEDAVGGHATSHQPSHDGVAGHTTFSCTALGLCPAGRGAVGSVEGLDGEPASPHSPDG